jgi:two-component system, cell cycle response regulator
MEPAAKKAKILVVDDEEHITDMVRVVLNQFGHEVFELNDPTKAEKKIKEWQPDLIVLDYAMPNLNGIQLLEMIRKQDNYTATIFVSGHSDPKKIVEVLNAGADDYIKKPFAFDEFSARVRVRLRLKELHDELRQANLRLKELSETDDVTGLLNMRSMFQRIEYALKQAQRYKRQVACIMLDIDHFKKANDEHDHLFGSFVLKELGEIIDDNIRDVDFAARYGGDEFLVVLTETTGVGAAAFAERLRVAVKNHLFSNDEDEMRINISLGLAISQKNEIVSAKGLIRRADKGLYEAKADGRDNVKLYQ